MMRFLLLWLSLTGWGLAAPLIDNPGFEQGLSGWSPLWTREAGAGTVSLDVQEKHGGQASARIDHHGQKDWSLESSRRLDVSPGDFFELDGWTKFVAPGIARVTLCVSTWDAKGGVVSWIYGGSTLDKSSAWTRLASRFVIPAGVTRMEVRLVGSGPAQAWIDDLSLVKIGNIHDLRRESLPATLTLENPVLQVTLNTTDATFAVLDKRTGRTWRQKVVLPEVALLDATAQDSRLDLSLLHVPSGLTLKATVQLDPARPEFTVELAAQGDLPSPVDYPSPFLAEAGDSLIVPLNEGISYPVDDPSISPMNLVAYGGNGICMAFWGVTNGQSGEMAILETPDDALIRIDRADGRLFIAPEWQAQKERFGYSRRIRYIFHDQGGYVAMAKRYRAYAQQTGLLKTLAQKRAENPNIDLLVGAVNVWCWESDSVQFVKEMQAAGIDRILWSNQQPPENLKALNHLGVLTSRYDIYEDVMNPANFPLLRYISEDWPTAAWPDDIIRDSSGAWVHGWDVEAKDGGRYPCGVINDVEALKYAHDRIPPDLATHPYGCRFIDTATVSSWREDYTPAHQMTRTQSRAARMELLRYVSQDCHLVVGSETGHDASVPYVDYFEGMLSLGPYRIPESGRDMQRIWNDIPPDVAKFQVGYAYRLPLWELVYHDCVVADWYWGDYNNKLPALWDRRDLFNSLYATPPMFMFDRALWNQNKARFVQSYQQIEPIVRAVGYSEMTDHRLLTTDRSVQQTVFADGTTVTVNFGSQPWSFPDGALLAAGGVRVDHATSR